MNKNENKAIKREITKKHIQVVLSPIITAIGVVLFWRYVLYENEIYFSQEAENPILYLIIPVVAFIYVIFASIAVNSVLDKYKEIENSALSADIDRFMLHKDQRVPTLLHILVGAPSIILIALTLLFNYVDLYIGAVAVFAVVFVVTQTWFIITELDNFHTRDNFKKKTPEHWHKKSSTEHFKNK